MIKLEHRGRAGTTGFSDNSHGRHRYAFFVFLTVKLAVAADLHRDPLRQSVNHRSTDTMQAARNLIGFAAELGTGMQYRHHRFQRRNTGIFLNIYRNAAAIILDRH